MNTNRDEDRRDRNYDWFVNESTVEDFSWNNRGMWGDGYLSKSIRLLAVGGRRREKLREGINLVITMLMTWSRKWEIDVGEGEGKKTKGKWTLIRYYNQGVK